MSLQILVLFALLVLNGMLSMSEIAIVTCRRSRLAAAADEGDTLARAALALRDDPITFLSTIQVGITSIGVLSGILGHRAFSAPLSAWLEGLGVSVRWAETVSTVCVVAVVTFLAIVVGELVPKRLGQIHAMSVARWMARPVALLAAVTKPFVFLLTRVTETLLALMGQRIADEESVTEEEIHALLAEGSRVGVIDAEEHHLVQNVFRLDARHIPSLMTPRGEITFLDLAKTDEENLARILAAPYSRFPVCDGDLDHVVGVVSAKPILSRVVNGEAPQIQRDLRPPLFVPETLTGMGVLERFRETGTHVMFVIDEYGEVEGMVTLQDLLDVVTGEIVTDEDRETQAFEREDGSWLLDGLMSVSELQDRLNLSQIPDAENRRYHTLSGMMMWLLGRMPRTGDVAVWDGWRFEVVDLDGRRVDKVQATPFSAGGSEGQSAS